jgi:small neutral amino acid transporter SnatA (MarC family)
MKPILLRFLKLFFLYAAISSIISFYVKGEIFEQTQFLKMLFKAAIFAAILALVFGLRKKS